jgi:hypothetical protein
MGAHANKILAYAYIDNTIKNGAILSILLKILNYKFNYKNIE